MKAKEAIIGAIGWYGVIAVVGAYALLSFEALDAKGIIYQMLNLTGALGVTIETWHKRDYQPFWLNLIWTLIAVIALVNLIKK